VRLCTVANARRQLVIVLILAVLYNAPKFAESRLDQRADGVVCAAHTSLIDYRLYLIIYGQASALPVQGTRYKVPHHLR